MTGPAPRPFNKGRLVLVFVGLAVVIVAAWLLLRARPEPAPVFAIDPPPADARPISFYLARADLARGETYFLARCGACHTIEAGGPHSIGPNLNGVMGRPVGTRPGFTASDGLREKGGTWDWETASAFLHSPRAFAPGTRMTFAGVTDPQNRADVMLYMNSQGGTLPPPAAAR